MLEQYLAMGKKLKNILLIDDDEAMNYYNKFVLAEADLVENLHVVYNGEEALEFLDGVKDGKYPRPELILLDINMPRMNGWEFLEAYDKLPQSQKSDIIIVMLTTSLMPSDQKAAEENKYITDFQSKPLEAKNIKVLIDKHYDA